MTLKRFKIHLTSQGSTLNPIPTLKQSGLLKIGDNEAMTARDVVSVLVASTALSESAAVEHFIKTVNLVDADGCSFGEALQGLLESGDPGVSSVHVCLSTPWARIALLNGNVLDYSHENSKPCAIRQEAVITGGFISMLAFMLNNETKSGWKGVKDESQA